MFQEAQHVNLSASAHQNPSTKERTHRDTGKCLTTGLKKLTTLCILSAWCEKRMPLHDSKYNDKHLRLRKNIRGHECTHPHIHRQYTTEKYHPNSGWLHTCSFCSLAWAVLNSFTCDAKSSTRLVVRYVCHSIVLHLKVNWQPFYEHLALKNFLCSIYCTFTILATQHIKYFTLGILQLVFTE